MNLFWTINIATPCACYRSPKPLGKVDFGTGTGQKEFFDAFVGDIPPPVHMLLQLCRKRGTGTGIRVSFPWIAQSG